MNADEAHPDEDSILTRLLACDEALAAGTPPQQPADAETPVQWQPRLQGDLACIQVLRQVLPRRPTGEPAALAAGSPTGETPVPPDLPFQQLGRFQLRRPLGQGAFGMVFLAADPQLGRAVALKVPRPEALLTSELRERFVREARAAAGLDHPNLVPVYEAGAVGPLCYIASAYCPGITLAQWLKSRSELTPERLAATLVATMADAVAHAHSRGVIHRDLKPSNVLLQRRRRDGADAHSTVQVSSGVHDSDGEEEFVPRITDFGLAKLTSEASAPMGDAVGVETRTGAVLGTPNYMAPEQASGKNKEIGPAADIYALGTILYELLTGRPPFRGESLFDTLEQVRSRDPLPPGRLRPKLRRDLDTICLKCLQKEPHKRYESASTLADDLRRFLRGEPIQARPIRVWERGLKWARRKPTQAALIAAIVLGPLVLFAASLAYETKLADKNAKLQQALDSAEVGELKARRFSYVSDMNLAPYDWASARMERLRELLRRQLPEGDELDLRGFEWHYWNRLANYSARWTQPGHEGEILCVACSPDGKLLASGDTKHTVRLWDAATGREWHKPIRFRNPVKAVAFAEGGQTLIAASEKTVFLVDVEGRKLRAFHERGSPIMAVAVAGRRMALGFFDGSVEIWELGKKAPSHILREHQRRVWAVTFSSDGNTLASGGDDGILRLWDVATGKPLEPFPRRQPSLIHSVAIAPDGKHVAAASHDGTVHLWDRVARKESILTGHTGEVWSVQFAPDSQTLVSAAADATVRLWNADGSPRFAFKGHTDGVHSAVFTPDGRTIVSAGADRSLNAWDVQPDRSSWLGHPKAVSQLAFTSTPSGSVLATGGDDGSVKLWEPATGRPLAALPPQPQSIQGLAFATDGKQLAVVCGDHLVHIYDRETGKEAASLAGHTMALTTVAFSPDGTKLASGAFDCTVRIWDWRTGKTIAVCSGHERSIRGLAFSRDGKLLASSSVDHTIKLWDPETGQLRPTHPMRHQAIVWGLTFSADGRTLASGGEDKTVRLWDVETGLSTMVLRGHSDTVRLLAFSPDGRTLASSSGEVKLWQAATGRELATFTEPGDIGSVAWAPRGFLLAGGGGNGVITIWNADTDSPRSPTARD